MTSPSKEGIVRNIPWKIALGVIGVLLVGGLIFHVLEHRRTERLRESLLLRQETLQQRIGPYYEAIAGRVPLLVAGLGGPYAGDWREPTLDLAAYRREPGLYLRLPLALAAAGREKSEQAACTQHTDALAGCLGLDAALYGRVLNEGQLLSAAYRQSLVEASNRTRLEALAEDLKVRVERDLPPLAGHLKARYLLVVLEEPPEGERQFQRIALWDLTRPGEQPVARGRTESAARLVPVRWVAKGFWPRHAQPDQQAANTAADCAIAAAIKPASGDPAPLSPGPGEAVPAPAPAGEAAPGGSGP